MLYTVDLQNNCYFVSEVFFFYRLPKSRNLINLKLQIMHRKFEPKKHWAKKSQGAKWEKLVA